MRGDLHVVIVRLDGEIIDQAACMSEEAAWETQSLLEETWEHEYQLVPDSVYVERFNAAQHGHLFTRSRNKTRACQEMLANRVERETPGWNDLGEYEVPARQRMQLDIPF